MNLEKAIEILKKQARYHNIEKIPGVPSSGKCWRLSWNNSSAEYTPRQLIKKARCFTHEYKNTAKSLVKEFSHGRNRSATRDLINSRNYDNIPSDKPTRTEDIWAWD